MSSTSRAPSQPRQPRRRRAGREHERVGPELVAGLSEGVAHGRRRYRLRCMSVQDGDRRDPHLRRNLVVRQHPDVRQHPREQPPQVRSQRRRAQKHRLCHGRLERAGDPRRETLRSRRVEREHRTLLGPDDRLQRALLERRREADRRQLALLGLIARQIARPSAARTASSITSGSFVIGAASAIASRIVVRSRTGTRSRSSCRSTRWTSPVPTTFGTSSSTSFGDVCADAIDQLLGLLPRRADRAGTCGSFPTGASRARSSDRRRCSRPPIARSRCSAAIHHAGSPNAGSRVGVPSSGRDAVPGLIASSRSGIQLAARDLDALHEDRVGRAARAAGCRRRAPAARPCRSRRDLLADRAHARRAACRPASRRRSRRARSRLRCRADRRRPAVSSASARRRCGGLRLVACRRRALAVRVGGARRAAPATTRNDNFGRPGISASADEHAGGDRQRPRPREQLRRDFLAEVRFRRGARRDQAARHRDEQRRNRRDQALADRQDRVGLGGGRQVEAVLERRR